MRTIFSPPSIKWYLTSLERFHKTQNLFLAGQMRQVVLLQAEFRFVDTEFLITVKTTFWILNILLSIYAYTYIAVRACLYINIYIQIHPTPCNAHTTLRKTGPLAGGRSLPDHRSSRTHPTVDVCHCLHSRSKHTRHFMLLHMTAGKRMESQGPGFPAERSGFCHFLKQRS